MQFIYEIREPTGQCVSGVLTANDTSDAMQQLRRAGRVILSLKEQVRADAPPAVLRRIRQDDILYFANQLAVMVDTGVPLTEALDAIAAQTDHSGMKAMLDAIADRVKGGEEFSRALEHYPKQFSRLFVAMMRASEASGTMGVMLRRVCDYMAQERDTVKRVKGAMVYPVCMLTFCAAVVIALLVFVLPRFKSVYAAKGAVLPAPTQILLSVSEGLCNNWLLLLGGAAVLGVGGLLALRTPAGRTFMDGVRIRLPLIGPMYRKACLSRSLRTMATMVSTGVSVLEGLRITGTVAGNVHYEKIWRELAERIKEGSSMADELYKCPLVPRTVSQMIAAGERTGKLGDVMNRLADFCDADLKVAIKTLTTMIEPAMIIIMGLLIGGIAMALLLPVFSISKVMAH